MTQDLQRTSTSPLKIGVLISGSGTNLQALIDAIAAGQLNAQIVLVISSKPDVQGLIRAQKAGIQTLSMNPSVYQNERVANGLIAEELQRAGAEYVVMAGYMRKVTEEVLHAFPDKVVNLHPALLPSFVGAHAIRDAFESGVKVTGVTVHFANEDYDRGPIIAQRAVSIEEEDTLETLEQRIHEVEHVLLPEVVQLIAEGRVVVREDRTVSILPQS
ncbi:phosphoribosylglycinamide formyltransferase [Anaerotardibacter muris]|uniref:phosphoribosylglycinamide formyltransferase n=1 Tax=Anaerotardibacter muris TaxID=2941505 RepID=UPI00203F0B1A|nr:phosphoribosylglycinamide formyltransferase [Anaerotardibacter muris]